MAGTVTPRWRLFANYTHIHSAILEHCNEYLVGQPLPNTPKNSLSLWTTYQAIENLTIGGGAVYQGVTTVNNPASEAAVLQQGAELLALRCSRGLPVGQGGGPAQPQQPHQQALLRAVLLGTRRPGEGRTVSLAGKYRF